MAKKPKYPPATRLFEKLVPIIWRDKNKPQSHFNHGYCLEITKSPSGAKFLDLTDMGDSVRYTPWGAYGGKVYKATDIEWDFKTETSEPERLYPG